MKQLFTLPLLTLSLALAACSTTVIEDDQRMLPDGQDPFTGTSFEMDPANSFIAFEGRSNIVNHEGQFDKFTVTITPDEENLQDFTLARVDVAIDVTSIATESRGLTNHLNEEDFFDTATYPIATFRSTSIMSTGENTYQITGDLTIKDTTLQATFDAVLTDDLLIAKYDLPRKVFDIGNDSYGDKLLEPLVPVEVQIAFQQ